MSNTTKGEKKVAYFTKLDPALREAMRQFKARTGVPEAQQIERAVREWLAERAEAWPLPQAPQRKAGRQQTKKRRTT